MPSREARSGHFLWVLVGQVAYACSQWAVLVVFSKLGSAQAVGQYAVGVALASPVFLLASMQLRNLQVTDARRELPLSTYVALRGASLAVAVVVLGCMIASAHMPRETALTLWAIIFFKCQESVADIYQGEMQANERMDWVGISLLLKALVMLAALTAVFALTRSSSLAVFASAFASLAVVFAYDVRRAHRTADRTAARFRAVLGLFKLAAPMGMVMALLSTTSNMPRYFLAASSGEEAVGAFSALFYFTIPGGLILSALGQTASPKLAKRHAAGDRRGFMLVMLRLLGVGVVMGIGGIAAVTIGGKPLIRLFYRPEFATYAPALLILMVAALGQYLSGCFGTTVTALRVFRTQVGLHLVLLGSSYVFCRRYVPGGGVLGAAKAVTATAAVGFAVYGITTFVALRLKARSRPMEAAEGLGRRGG
jgi:O-antigen/teichoic acid export membrane protein